MRTSILCAFLALFASSCGGAQQGGSQAASGDLRDEENPFTVSELPNVPTELRAQLDEITMRGRVIAQYEIAAANATDVLMATNPDRSGMEMFLATGSQEDWNVYFGKLSEDKASFEVAYGLSCKQGNCSMGPSDSTEDLVPLARAVDVAQHSIEPKTDRYNVNVLREADGTITVYFTPGNTNPDIVLLGGDYRVSVSGDGNKVLKSTPLHVSILEQAIKGPEGGRILGTMITNILTETPNETDVAMTILNPVISPRLVVCENWMYRIEKNGDIVVIANKGLASAGD